MNTNQTALFFANEVQPKKDWVQLHHLITDRGSKYSVTGGKVESEEGVKVFIKELKTNKKYLKATHNTFAARIVEEGKVIERKSDDGETGAGMVILRTLRHANMVNVIVVVTRWYGGVKLYADRFKHVQDSAREVLKEVG